LYSKVRNASLILKNINPDKEIFPVIVFEGNGWEASMVKSLLTNAEIEVFIKDETMGVLAPWNVTADGASSVKVIVFNVDLNRAKEVVKGFENAQWKS